MTQLEKGMIYELRIYHSMPDDYQRCSRASRTTRYGFGKSMASARLDSGQR
ncbi:hypothetical protein [Scytonema sp. PRP1]|uniref:hypothetical protein n=1 Tax=Scytonema sp. PRP1 TaxID=3120513 RepID=UPI00300D392C